MSCRHQEAVAISAGVKRTRVHREGAFEAEGEAYLDQIWLVATIGRLITVDELGHRQQALSIEGDGWAAHGSSNAAEK